MDGVYLDNAATTRVLPAVAEAMVRAATESFGNPSSLHQSGADARRTVEDARASIARVLGVDPDEITFTSGGTEANNLGVRGLPRLGEGSHAILSAVEHPSVFSQRAWLEERGVEVDLLGVDRDGVADLEALDDLLREDTRLVAVMAVNNETGAIQPLADIVTATRAVAVDAHVHSDVVQAFGKLSAPVRAWGVDSASCTAHKIHGPKGVGALYVRRGRHLNARVSGGSQERGVRPGTENVPGIVAFGRAARLMGEEAFETRARELRARLLDALAADPTLAGVGPLVDPKRAAPHIVAIRADGCASERLLHFLEREGVEVSSGSACHAGRDDLSHVVRALGYATDPGSIRVSFGSDTPDDAPERLVSALRRAVPVVRGLGTLR